MIIPSMSPKRWLALSVLFVASLSLVIWGVTRWLSPAPPRSVRMSTGITDGGYHQLGLKYQAILKQHGIELILLPSKGSLQNIDRLYNAAVDVAFVQGGIGRLTLPPDKTPEDVPLRSLGIMGYEPMWLFASAELAKQITSAGSLAPLKSKRIAVGDDGSGTQRVALELLRLHGATRDNSDLRAIGGTTAVADLNTAKIDAAILISIAQSPVVQAMLASETAQLVSIPQADGLARQLPYLSPITLYRGALNAATQKPASDITLLATTANLVAHEDTHPAIMYLLLEAASHIQVAPSLFNKAGEFPRSMGTDFILADEAQRYYKEGRPFLQRYLPFWAANALQRFLLILVPLLAIGLPVIKFIPEAMRFRHNQRLYRKYERLLRMETEIRARQLDQQEINVYTTELTRIERNIESTKFPLDYSDRVYTLRQHVDYVRLQLTQERLNLDNQTQPS